MVLSVSPFQDLLLTQTGWLQGVHHYTPTSHPLNTHSTKQLYLEMNKMEDRMGVEGREEEKEM